jgi:hypothetical protein
MASCHQAKGAAMVDGAVEIVGLIPAGQAAIQGQPKAITGRGQEPDPCKTDPPKPWG